SSGGALRAGAGRRGRCAGRRWPPPPPPRRTARRPPPTVCSRRWPPCTARRRRPRRGCPRPSVGARGPDRVDELLDQGEVGVTVEVGGHDLLGGGDGQRGHLTADVGD